MRFVPILLALGASVVRGSQTCVVPFGGPGVDDTIGLTSLLSNASCKSDAQILFQAETTYNISTPVQMTGLSNVEITILGNLDLPRSIPYVQNLVNTSTGGRLYWFTVSGDNVTLSGNQDENWGWVDAYGEPWWQLAPVTQPLGGLANRPHAWSINVNNSAIRYMKLRKPIAWGMSVQGNNNHIYSVKIDAAYDLDNPSAFPFNTDGFDISGNNYLIEDVWAFNGDDCVAVNKGNNITFRDSTCEGGHGASLSATTGVSNVLFDNLTLANELYGGRFKSSLNSVGNITNVTWSNIHIHNVTFPIFATGVYFDQNTNRGRTPGVYPANSTATHISNFLWENFTGTINDVHPGDGSCVTDPCWYYVANATNNAAVTLQLLNNTATNIQVRNVHLTPYDGQGQADVLCDPQSFTDGVAHLGFQCRNGVYTPVSV